jgi:hypothetical protein
VQVRHRRRAAEDGPPSAAARSYSRAASSEARARSGRDWRQLVPGRGDLEVGEHDRLLPVPGDVSQLVVAGAHRRLDGLGQLEVDYGELPPGTAVLDGLAHASWTNR